MQENASLEKQKGEQEAFMQDLADDARFLTHLLHDKRISSMMALPLTEKLQALHEWSDTERKIHAFFQEWENSQEKKATLEQQQQPHHLAASLMTPAQVAKTKDFPVDEQGHLILPIFLGRSNVRVSILHLGMQSFVFDLPTHSLFNSVHIIGYLPINPTNFNNEHYIYPIGFLSKRKFFDVADGTKKTYYQCKVTVDPTSLPEDGNISELTVLRPLFQIAPQSEGQPMEDTDLGRLFERFLDRFDAFAKMESEWPTFHSGEDFFGLDHAPIKKYIQVRIHQSVLLSIYKVYS
jgi:hypothetical protein